MTRSTEATGFSLVPLSSRPSAIVSPEEATAILGTFVQFSSAGSNVNGSEENITREWTLRSPTGSKAEIEYEEEDGSLIRLEADVTGTYIVQLVVSRDGVQSEPTRSAVFFSPIVVPSVKRVSPPGDFMYKVLGSFWELVNDREVFPTLWSGYTQLVASDLLRAMQIDRAKSIQTIQPLFQKKWISYSPTISLDHSKCTSIWARHQSGRGAFTGTVTFVNKGIIVSDTEIILDSAVTPKAIGTTLTVYSGSNVGDFLINRINSAGTGYIVSATTPFANFRLERVVSAADLEYLIRKPKEVYSPSVDFSSLDIENGDYLKIRNTRNAGYWKITAIGTAGGLSNDFSLLLDRPLPITSGGMSFEIIRSSRVSFVKKESSHTDTVYIPLDEANLYEFSKQNLLGTGGKIASNYEILVNRDHILDSAIGARLKITSGLNTGKTYIISGINPAKTGYLVVKEFGSSVLGSTASYEIEVNIDVKDHLLVLEDEAHRISRVDTLMDLAPTTEGGRGPLWVVTLQKPTATSGLERLNWRIGTTIQTSEFADVKELGVRRGDTLLIDVYREDIDATATLSAQVTGCVDNLFSIEMGIEDLQWGDDWFGELVPTEVISLCSSLGIPTARLSSVDDTTVLFLDLSVQVRAFILSQQFKAQIFNIKTTGNTLLDIPNFFSFYLRPSKIIRNSSIGLSDLEKNGDYPIVSIPALHEYINPERVSETEEGTYRIAYSDGTWKDLNKAPISMVENINYVLSNQTSLRGFEARLIANSEEITFGDVDLIAQSVRVGDQIEITSGINIGTYIISRIQDETTLRVSGDSLDGSLPPYTESNVQYKIHRQVAGNFLYFSSAFSPKNPAPEYLWAPTTLVDNFKYIEDNFGVLVGVTKESLDQYGATQVSFRSSVEALMYCWTMGPTLSSAKIGAHTLLDLPVTETSCQIIEIREDYTNNLGRVLTEDLSAEGNGTGIFRTYRYRKTASTYPNLDFDGLAINPNTSEVFQEGDILPEFTTLTNSVKIVDRISDPESLRGLSPYYGKEALQKFHTWQAEIDLRAVDSRDMPLVSEFLMNIRPIYTKPKIVGVISFIDEVIVEVELFIDILLRFFDDPAFSRESTHKLDDLRNRAIDLGSFGSRTLFTGSDLTLGEIRDGRQVVNSARFVQKFQYQEEEEWELSSINKYFAGGTKIRAFGQLVRQGDVLFILDGRNRGRYRVADTYENGDLALEVYEGDAPRAIDPLDMREDVPARFIVQRENGYLIYSPPTGADHNQNIYIHADYEDTSSIEVLDLKEQHVPFVANGVTANDVLIVEDRFAEIDSPGIWSPDQQTYIDTHRYLTLKTPIDLSGMGVGAFNWRIERWSLLSNPIVTGTADVLAGAANLTLREDSKNHIVYMRSGDELHIEGQVYRISSVIQGAHLIVVDQEFEADGIVEFSLVRPVLDEDDVDSDTRLERLFAEDKVEVEIFFPLVLLSSLNNKTLSDTQNLEALSGLIQLEDNDAPFTVPEEHRSGVFYGDNAEGLVSTQFLSRKNGFLVEVLVSAEDTTGDGVLDSTTSVSHGVYAPLTHLDLPNNNSLVPQENEIFVSSLFPGVQATTEESAVIPEENYSINVYARAANFTLTFGHNFDANGNWVPLPEEDRPVGSIGGIMVSYEGDIFLSDGVTETNFVDMEVLPGDFFQFWWKTPEGELKEDTLQIVDVFPKLFSVNSIMDLNVQASGRIFRREPQ